MPTRKENNLSPLFLCIYFGLLFTRPIFDRIIITRAHIQGDLFLMTYYRRRWTVCLVLWRCSCFFSALVRRNQPIFNESTTSIANRKKIKLWLWLFIFGAGQKTKKPVHTHYPYRLKWSNVVGTIPASQ